MLTRICKIVVLSFDIMSNSEVTIVSFVLTFILIRSADLQLIFLLVVVFQNGPFSKLFDHLNYNLSFSVAHESQ